MDNYQSKVRDTAGNDYRTDRDAAVVIRFNTEPEAPAKSRRYAAKETLYRKGDTIASLCRVRSGLIKLLSYLPNGRTRTVRLCGQGDLLGLEGLLKQSFQHTAITLCDAEIDYLWPNRLHRLERDDPAEYCQLLRKGLLQLNGSDRWIADFSTGDIKSRVANLVDFLSNLKFGENSNTVELLTVYEMADILGVTAESVSRILAEFKRNGILHPRQGSSRETYRIDYAQLQQQIRK